MFATSLGIFIFGLVTAFAGGAIGAALGANYAFVLTGFAVLTSWGLLAATGDTFGLTYLAFGPFMGPHITFAAGAAAAIYARYRGYVDNGKDVNTPLAGLGKPDILFVGSVFGVFGYLCQIGVSKIAWFGSHTDSVALSVLLSGILARFVFGGVPAKGLFRGSLHNPEAFHPEATSFPAKIKPGPNGRWLEWQEKPSQLLTIGTLFGIMAGGASLFLAANVGAHLTSMGLSNQLAADNANSFGFGVSAVIILFLITNRNMPVQHHVTNIAGLAAVKFFPILMGGTRNGFTWTATSSWDSRTWVLAAVALAIAAVFGVVAAALAEFAARLWYDRGTSHIDPPAAGIWLANTVVVSLAAFVA